MARIFLLFSALAVLIPQLYSQLPDSFGELIYSQDLGSQTPTPDRSLTGIQYADSALWVTGYDPDDYWQHKLYKFNTTGTQLLNTYSYGIEAAGWNDMAFDGEYLYVTDMDTIRQLNPQNGEKTGFVIPAPFYYNRGLAYNPANNHFYVSGEGGFNIYEIDFDGNIVGAIGGDLGTYYVGLAIDTISPGGPFLWSYANEEVGYGLQLKAKQISLQTNQFTGLEFEGASISNIISETAGGATITYSPAFDTVKLITINIRNGNSQDQYEYAMFYDITLDEVPGPQISVTPDFIQNTLPQGDSMDVDITVLNDGDAPLFWSAYIETPEQDTIDNLGDLLYSFNATQQSGTNDKGIKGITYLDDKIWVNGFSYSSSQAAIYSFDKDGNLLSTHPYNALNNSGFYSLTSDGEYLYGEDTYSITQIDPDNFSVVGYIIKTGGSYRDMTYDPQTDYFWGGNSNGLIRKFDRDGDVISEFITPFEIKGMAWDQWAPGGPFLWVWVMSDDGLGVEAKRLDPHTCTPVGNGFQGNSFSNDSLFTDSPGGVVITNQYEPNKVSLLGLHNAAILTPTDTLQNVDFVASYDLDVTPPPAWINLENPSFGSVASGESAQFNVRLYSLMDDTVMTANIRISNNDILFPEVAIPVTFEMSIANLTGIVSIEDNKDKILANNYPNPMSGQSTFEIYLPRATAVDLRIYDQRGQQVEVLADTWMEKGTHLLKYNAEKLKPGIYLYIVQTDEESLTKRMIVK